ncbi:phycobilisome rod-core linker polypeptide [Roseofilum casamattae]|uniref:Phycobilisome rod-core linker polypeptide n=1 Tax=Roseofilum casamattae BLCC-M143 TaxID=3022442 RepID=A0ABT7BX16_9CYAN|nr:phycobilisome rod-core linker polypeptide [Roseofilum casamattae]MDJ1183735.1 phycobilisome rod-core linker polypeptide [Roseofilum casamattae BLCC-M143]
MLPVSTPITVSRKSPLEERQQALTAIYYQVLERQPYEYERDLLAKAERSFLRDKIGVRRFLKELSHSCIYLDSFYYCYSNVKFLELCMKHFLGRAPKNNEEIQYYSQILTTKGVNELMTSILDSEEYRKVFGCFTVPYARIPEIYESPQSYLETQWLNAEHIGQRGTSLPTHYWHGLGLVCEEGVCHYPDEDDRADRPKSENDNILVQQFMKLVESEKGQAVLASIPPQKLAKLRQAIGS